MFGKPSIADYYRHISKDIEGLILRESNEKISATSADILAQEYVNIYSLPSIELEQDKQRISPEKYVKRISAHERESFHRNDGDMDFECERVVAVFPIKTNEKMEYISKLTTSQFSLSWSPEHDLEFSPNHIKFVVEIKGYGFNHSEDENKVMNMVKQQKDRMLGWVKNVNDDIEQNNKSLVAQLVTSIENRKQKITKDDGRLTSLGDKLNKI